METGLARRALRWERNAFLVQAVHLPLVVVFWLWILPALWRRWRRHRSLAWCSGIAAGLGHLVVISPYVGDWGPWWALPARPGDTLLGDIFVTVVEIPLIIVAFILAMLPVEARPLSDLLMKTLLPGGRIPWASDGLQAGVILVGGTLLWIGIGSFGGLILAGRRKVKEEGEAEPGPDDSANLDSGDETPAEP